MAASALWLLGKVHYMGYYLTSIVLLLLAIAIADRNAKLEDAEKAQRCIVIRHPRLYLWVGGLLVAIVAGLYAWSFFDPESFAGKTWPVDLVFCAFALGGVGIIQSTLSFQIVLEQRGNTFRYRTFFFRVHTISFQECLCYYERKKLQDRVIVTRKQVIFCDDWDIHSDALPRLCKQRGVPLVSARVGRKLRRGRRKLGKE